MHIVIAVLTAAAGLIWALYRLQNSGVDLNAFNPFYWMRRRRWEKQLGIKPIHNLQNPMESAALLVVAMGSIDGAVTRELKQETIDLFDTEFGVGQARATELFMESSHLLKDVVNIVEEVKHVLTPSFEQYQKRHKESLLSMLKTMSEKEGAPSKKQEQLLQKIAEVLMDSSATRAHW